MKFASYFIACICGFFCLLAATGIVLAAIFGMTDPLYVKSFQVSFWGFVIFFVLHLVLGGQAKAFKFWGKSSKM